MTEVSKKFQSKIRNGGVGNIQSDPTNGGITNGGHGKPVTCISAQPKLPTHL